MLYKVTVRVLRSVQNTNTMWAPCKIVEYVEWYVQKPLGFKRAIEVFKRPKFESGRLWKQRLYVQKDDYLLMCSDSIM
jgi:hypothetical protein